MISKILELEYRRRTNIANTMSMFADIDPNQDDLLAELMQDVHREDWLSGLNEGLQAAQLEDGADILKRSQSSPSIPNQESAFAAAVLGQDEFNLNEQQGGWCSSTPMAIRPMRRANAEDYSSLESSQSFLGGNFGGSMSLTDEAMLGSAAGKKGSGPLKADKTANGGIPPIPPPGTSRSSGSSLGYYSKPNSMPSRISRDSQQTPFAPTVTIPAQGGHWAWVPEPTADGIPAAPPPFQPPTNLHNVPVKSGRLPLPSTKCDETDFLNMDILENFDVLEMANTLVLEQGPGRRHTSQRLHGSCPLPALLEDALSVEEGGSDSTMQTSLGNSSPSNDERFQVAMQETYHKGHGRQRPSSIPIPGTRSAPLKVQRPSRSHSSPHLASNLLASSCPVYGERPVRGAARRSVAVAAASLSDATDEFDPDFTDGLSDVAQRALRRANSTGSGKKKHNPWSTEETLALINGVRTTGIGKWAEIKRLAHPGIADVLDNRSPVDLKDKWRNLTRIAKLPKASLKARLQRGQSDISLETMLLVKELMENSHPSDHH